MCYGKDLLFYNSKAISRSERRVLRRNERAIEQYTNDLLKRQYEAVMKAYRKYSRSQKDLTEDIDNLFDSFDDTDYIVSVIAVESSAMDFGAKGRIKKTKLAQFGISFDLQHPLAVEYLQTDRPLILSKISETTKKQVKPFLLEAVKTGESPQALAKKLSDEFLFSEERALMIATHEVGTAYEAGNIIPMLDAKARGLKSEKAWLTVGDEKVTPTHTQNQDDGWLDVEETFSGTGDKEAPASDNPRCRCTMLYRIND